MSSREQLEELLGQIQNISRLLHEAGIDMPDLDDPNNEEEEKEIKVAEAQSLDEYHPPSFPVEKHRMGWFSSRTYSSLPVSSQSYYSVCPICVSPYESTDQVSFLPCQKHLFHTECIYPWISSCSHVCPVCRYDVSKGNPPHEDCESFSISSSTPRLSRLLISDDDLLSFYPQ